MNQQKVMRCKLVCMLNEPSKFQNADEPSNQVRMAAVWEGSTEKQQTSENAVFGKMTPCAEFVATIKNPEVISKIKQGKTYYVEFIEVED